MTFADPERLWLLVPVAALLVAYVLVQRRRGTYALRFSDTALFDAVAPKRPRWRRHLVALCFVAAVAAMAIAIAGPKREEQIPRERATVMLTMDTSLSMGADDVDPTRIDAAKAAALDFLADAPPTVDIGLVSFDGFPVIRVQPTTDRTVMKSAVESLNLGEMTMTGDAIFAALDVIENATAGDAADPGDDDSPAAVIVLLSDGTPTEGGRTVEEAATAAASAGIPVSTVAFGTADGVVEIPDIENPGQTVVVPVPVDEPTLSYIAETSGGTAFSADSADELAAVYRDIGTSVGLETIDRDVSDWFTGAALALGFLTGLLSLLWFQRLP